MEGGLEWGFRVGVMTPRIGIGRHEEWGGVPYCGLTILEGPEPGD